MKLLFLVYIFIEVLVSSSIIARLGGLGTFLEIILSALLGMYILKNFKFALLENLVSLKEGKITQESFMKLNLFTALGALLLILPGFVSDFFGILLQFSFFASLISRKFFKKNTANEDLHNKFKNKGNEDVIDVEVIDDREPISK